MWTWAAARLAARRSRRSSPTTSPVRREVEAARPRPERDVALHPHRSGNRDRCSRGVQRARLTVEPRALARRNPGNDRNSASPPATDVATPGRFTLRSGAVKAVLDVRTRSGCASPGAARSGRSRCPSRGRTTCSCAPCGPGVSRGTETLVFRGGVPPSQYAAMRAPFQEGDFPGPVKYGYLNVGVVEQGPPRAARPHRLLPLPAPDRLRRAGRRRDGRARRTCRPPAPCSPAPSRPPSTRCGTPRRWSATGSPSSAPAWSAAASPACSPVPGRRRSRSWTSIPAAPTSRPRSASTSRCRPTPPTAATWSCTPARRPPGSSGRSTCSRPRAPSSTSAGTATRRSGSRWAARSTPAASASARARSAPSPRPARRAARRPTGWRSRSTCCATPPSTRSSPASRRFDELPDVMARLAAGSLPALCHTITYGEG